VLFSAALALIYGTSALIFGSSDALQILSVSTRCLLFIFVGAIVSYLSERLGVSERRLNDMIEFLPDATYAIDCEGYVIAWNRAMEELTGIPKIRVLDRGNYEHAIPFFRERRPMLADMMCREEISPVGMFPGLTRKGRDCEYEIFIPHFREGKGAHLRMSATVFTDPKGRVTGAIETIRDVTSQKLLDAALQNTSRRLAIVAGIVRNDIAKNLSEMYSNLTLSAMKSDDPEVLSLISNLKESANRIRQQIELSREFRDIGTSPPGWIPVQAAVREAIVRTAAPEIGFRAWTERLEVFSDPHLPAVFYYLFLFSKREAPSPASVVVTYQIRGDECAIIIEDNGQGIPDDVKGALFAQRNPGTGCGLFLAHEILSISGMTIRETGVFGKGLRFEIIVPSEGFRISGGNGEPAGPGQGNGEGEHAALSGGPAASASGPNVDARELRPDEFPRADQVWKEYHDTEGNPETDRIFAAFSRGALVSVGRCRRHGGSIEVDGVFTPAVHRHRGYAGKVMAALVEACHNDDLYMYAVRNLAGFGFEPIPESGLPLAIQERYRWASGNMEGAEVQPMRRRPGL
jgi:PAS domain S-box-containing protein